MQPDNASAAMATTNDIRNARTSRTKAVPSHEISFGSAPLWLTNGILQESRTATGEPGNQFRE
jgi:hypothetical protein